MVYNLLNIIKSSLKSTEVNFFLRKSNSSVRMGFTSSNPTITENNKTVHFGPPTRKTLNAVLCTLRYVLRPADQSFAGLRNVMENGNTFLSTDRCV